MIEMPIIEQEICDGCGLCVMVCPCSTLALIQDIVRIVNNECNFCTDCEAVCIHKAIRCPYEIVIEAY
jgi:NAD-dependent dihydropyrimidine dehydrogenase PreA subunit